MNPKRYLVTLRGCAVGVSAFTENEAIILAQAKAIQEARDYQLVKVEEMNPYFKGGSVYAEII